jgi:membrane protein implicated in regulation of membrane protease activity
MSSYFYAPGMSGGLVDRERSAAARTVVVAGSVKAALTVLLVVGFVAGCSSVLLAPWPLAAQFVVLAVVALNVLLLRRFCAALHSCANASLQDLRAISSDLPQ